MSELINRQDLEFILYDLLDADALQNYPAYSEHNRETYTAFIDTAEKLAEKYFLNHNAKADANEPQFDGNKVKLIPEVAVALDHYNDSGFPGARHSYENGGMQLPGLIASACQSFFVAANPGTAGYPFLTAAASNLIATFGSAKQKKQYLPGMLDGSIFGTMALTEPAAGSSLGDLTSTATAQTDGNYLIKGQKMFISAGDHQLSNNIVHLVLARIKGAPIGVKGISLFIVPKYLPASQNRSAQDNDVKLAGLIHKMGYRGTSSTVLNFGENNHCKGFLIGAPNQGLMYMFKMMNEARIGVGLGATMIGYRGYLSSLDYARNRPQGRLPSNRDPASKPVMLIEHADIRRMLLAQKSYVEGSLALCLYAARLMDDAEAGTDADKCLRASKLLDLLTPIVKSFPSDYGPRANDLAIQVLGGAGYTRDYPVEQCYRDNRLNPIHEGTYGIQALDLLGRKLWSHNGEAYMLLCENILATVNAAKDQEKFNQQADAIAQALNSLTAVNQILKLAMQSKGPDRTLANASLYLDCLSKIVISWLWLKQAVIATEKLQQENKTGIDKNFLQGKCQAARYFITWELPQIYPAIELLKNLDPICFQMQDSWF